MYNSNLRFTEDDWQRIERDWTAWWAHDLRRPMITASVTAPPERQRPAWWGPLAAVPLSVSGEEMAEAFFDEYVRTTWFGDFWPKLGLSGFGPGVGAAFLGGRLEVASGSAWFHPGQWEGKPLAEITPEFDPDNIWWRRVRDVAAAFLARFGRQVQLSFTDIGGNLEIAASLRGNQELLMDFIDDPEGVDALSDRLTALWLRMQREHAAPIIAAGRGTSTWVSVWSPGHTCMLGNDIAYMMSPDMFARWVTPFLTTACAALDHGFYHLDGSGQIPHLDHLLAVPGLHGVQWNGDPHMAAAGPESWPLLKRIRDAGKLVHITGDGEAILRLAREVPLDGFAIHLLAKERHAELIAAIHRANAELIRRVTVSGADF